MTGKGFLERISFEFDYLDREPSPCAGESCDKLGINVLRGVPYCAHHLAHTIVMSMRDDIQEENKTTQ